MEGLDENDFTHKRVLKFTLLYGAQCEIFLKIQALFGFKILSHIFE